MFELLIAVLLTILHVRKGWQDLDVPEPYGAETLYFALLVNFAY